MTQAVEAKRVRAGRFTLMQRPAGETWKALTEPARLRAWLCDEARIDLRVGGRFALEGPTVPRHSGVQTIAALEPGRLLALDWPMGGVPTRVAFTLEPQMDCTRVTALQEVPSGSEIGFPNPSGKPLDRRNRIYLEETWACVLMQLRCHLETGRVPMRHDFSTPPGDEIRRQVEVPASPTEAYAALTRPERIDQWMGKKATVDLKVGGTFLYGWGGWEVPKRIVDLVPDRRIVQEWTELGPPTLVRWEIEPVAGKQGAWARITMVHSGFAGHPDACRDVQAGWSDFVLRLALHLERRIPVPFWEGELRE